MRGKCLCGEIQFEITGVIPKIYQCHCSLCRKQGGSSSNTATVVKEENFRWLSGEEYISSWIKATGFRSDFCSQCGSPVPNRLRASSYFWIPVGLLDSEVKMKIFAHLCVGSKASWDMIASQGTQYEAMPEDLSQFIEHLHTGTDADLFS